MSPLGMTRIGGLSILAYVGGVISQHQTNECRSTEKRQGNLITPGNSFRVLFQALMSNKVQSFPVTVENMSHQEN